MISLNYISAISIKKEYYDFCQEKNEREKKKERKKNDEITKKERRKKDH